MKQLLAILLVAAAAAALALRPIDDPVAASGARVERVVDGDTLLARTATGARERVRLLGVDTPESVKPDAPVECFGKAAAAHLRRLVDGERVRLSTDEEARDRFGRLLAYVERTRDGLDVNAALVEGGFARVVAYRPNVRHEDRYRRLERSARRAGRGLWGACG